jgi:hypothetical protein
VICGAVLPSCAAYLLLVFNPRHRLYLNMPLLYTVTAYRI